MTVRTPESVMHELDYWRAVLEDVREINDLLSEVAEPLPGVAIETLSLVIGREDAAVVAGRANDRVMRSMKALARMDAPLHRILSLIEGRQLALEQESV